MKFIPDFLLDFSNDSAKSLYEKSSLDELNEIYESVIPNVKIGLVFSEAALV